MKTDRKKKAVLGVSTSELVRSYKVFMAQFAENKVLLRRQRAGDSCDVEKRPRAESETEKTTR